MNLDKRNKGNGVILKSSLRLIIKISTKNLVAIMLKLSIKSKRNGWILRNKELSLLTTDLVMEHINGAF